MVRYQQNPLANGDQQPQEDHNTHMTNKAIGSSLQVALSDNVVHDRTRMHHLLHLILRPSKNRVPNNSKSRLEHTKYPIDILRAALLALCKS
jgi:hypothetical protein